MFYPLSKLAAEVLRNLPGAPNGLSVDELAEDLLKARGPKQRSKIIYALADIGWLLGGLAVRRGDDDLGHADVKLWGLPLDTLAVVRRICERPKRPIPLVTRYR